jgi:uncharacterized protein YacL
MADEPPVAGVEHDASGVAAPERGPSRLSPAEQAAQQRLALVRIVRMAFVVMIVTVTLLYIINTGQSQSGGDTAFGISLAIGWHIPLTAGLVLCLLVLAIDLLTPSKKIATISGVFFGLLVGLIAAFATTFIIDLLVQAYEIRAPDLVAAIKVLVGISLCYLGMSSVLQTQDDFRLVIPYVEFAKQLRGPRPLLLDTSALIDARIVDVAATGILSVPIVIPRFVVEELQRLADSSDKQKRARGRRGLDAIPRLRRNPALDVTIDDSPVPGKAVDQMLVELARSMDGAIVTADTGLNRIAGIQGVVVLNLNDVANALKPSLIAGSRLTLELVRRGEQAGQAVGFLDDGTMVVAEQAEDRIGQRVELEVSGALQTSAGRLIFARPADEGGVLRQSAPEHAPGEESQPDERDDQRGPRDAGPATDEPGAPASTLPSTTVRPPPPPPPLRPGPFPPNRPARSSAPRNPRR